MRVCADERCGHADDTLRLFSEWVQWLRARELALRVLSELRKWHKPDVISYVTPPERPPD